MELGSVDWFGGYNSKIDRENNFGFLLPINSGEKLFVHKKELRNTNTLDEGEIVLYERGVGRSGKPCAQNVYDLPFRESKTANLLATYLLHSKQSSQALASSMYRNFLVNVLNSKIGSDLAKELGQNNKLDSSHLSLLKDTRNYSQLFCVYIGGTDFDSLVSKGICPTLMPAGFIDDNISLFCRWIVQLNREEYEKIADKLVLHLSLSALLHLVFLNLIDSNLALKLRRKDIESFVRCNFTKEDSGVKQFVRDTYQSQFSSVSEYFNHPVIKPLAGRYLVKFKMFNKDLSFTDVIDSKAELVNDPEFFILSKLLPLLNPKNNYDAIEAVILHEIWQGLLNGQIPVDHPSIFKLFPQCQTLRVNFPNINLSCEAFHWQVKQDNGSKDAMYLCRSKKCSDPQVLPDLSKHYIDYNIYDWLSHYGVDYATEKQPSKRDFPIKLAGYFNRIRELYQRLHCRCCGTLMVPNLKYARVEVTTFDRAVNSFVTRPFQAAYRLTVFKCSNNTCPEFDVDYYINHCIGFKCNAVIDSRELTEKCSEGRFICKSCGSCCNHHKEKYGYVNNGESDQVRYNRTYGDSPFYSTNKK
ncbi:cold shock domain-containing protein [Vibrio metschnikovii]|uniref:cold shock domain-containing protein n=1 Tax=Vibrio metschnikovii TaxID=28172 RepID=UPI00165E4AAA|nr:cold shock domain-containing protein [Vibrio metschnikovii]EKO3646383.1 cold shock domain-containing protein [Vibrio metschnikovii]